MNRLFKELLIGGRIISTTGILKYRHFNDWIYAAGYGSGNEENCYRILFALKRKWYDRIIWFICNGRADNLRRDIVRKSKYWPGISNIDFAVYKGIQYSYMLVVPKETILKLCNDTRWLLRYCDKCIIDVRLEFVINNIRKRETGCTYCGDRTLCNELEINTAMMREVFGVC